MHVQCTCDAISCSGVNPCKMHRVVAMPTALKFVVSNVETIFVVTFKRNFSMSRRFRNSVNVVDVTSRA